MKSSLPRSGASSSEKTSSRPAFTAAGLITLLCAGLFFPGTVTPLEKRPPLLMFPFVAARGTGTPLERTLTGIVTERLSASGSLALTAPPRSKDLASEHGIDISGRSGEESMRTVADRSGFPFFVSGETRLIGTDLVVIARLTFTKSGSVTEISSSGPRTGSIRPVMTGAAEALGERAAFVVKNPSVSVASASSPPFFCSDPLGRSLPKLYLDIRESYGGHSRDASSSRRELIHLLLECGFKLENRKKEADLIIFGRAVGSAITKDSLSGLSRADVEFRAVDPRVGRLLGTGAASLSRNDHSAAPPGTEAFRAATASAVSDLATGIVRAWETLR